MGKTKCFQHMMMEKLAIYMKKYLYLIIYKKVKSKWIIYIVTYIVENLYNLK